MGKLTKVSSLLLVAMLVIGSILFMGCVSESMRVDRKAQEEILLRAQKVVPIYQTQNFLARQAINEYMERMDVSDKLWYIYLLADSGAFIGYYISRTYPLSIAVGMTNPQRSYSSSSSSFSMPAPGVDGVFWNGVDSRVHYFFDAETNALGQFNCQYVLFDMPLDVDVPLLRVKVEGNS